MYLDSAATSQKPRQVIEALDRLLRAAQREHPSRRLHAGRGGHRDVRGGPAHAGHLRRRARARLHRVHPGYHRVGQPRGARLRDARSSAKGTRSCCQPDRAPLEPRPLAVHGPRGRAPGCGSSPWLEDGRSTSARARLAGHRAERRSSPSPGCRTSWEPCRRCGRSPTPPTASVRDPGGGRRAARSAPRRSTSSSSAATSSRSPATRCWARRRRAACTPRGTSSNAWIPSWAAAR